LHWIDSNILIAALAWSMVLIALCLLFKLWHRRFQSVARLLVLVGATGLAVQILSTEQRLVFGYFPALSLIALGIGLQTKSHIPNLALLVSLYFSAAGHKLFNFAKMQIYIPEAISARLPEELVRLAPGLVQMIPIFLSHIVVPLEFSMALLLFFPKTRFLGFILAVIFHTLVAVFTNNADGLANVGLFVLIGHAGLFVLSDRRTWLVRNTKLSTQEGRLFFASIALVALFGTLALFEFEVAGLIGLHRAILYFSMFVAIVIYTQLDPHATAQVEPKGEFSTFATNFKLKAWFCFLIAWALYPALIGYRNQQFGWAMMSGASREEPVKCIVVQSNACVDALDLDPVAGVYAGLHGTVIATRQPIYFDRIEKHIAKICRSRVLSRGDAYRDKTVRCRVSEEL
jgi:hypothetical protein